MAVPPDGPQRIERRAHGRRLARRNPRRQEMRRVIERHHERGIFGSQQVEEKSFDRRAGVEDPLAEHAVADVEEHAQSHRHAIVRELRDRLRFAVLEDGEGVFWQVRDQPAVAVPDRRPSRLSTRCSTGSSRDDRIGGACAVSTAMLTPAPRTASAASRTPPCDHPISVIRASILPESFRAPARGLDPGRDRVT